MPLSSGHTSLQHCWSKSCPIPRRLTPKRSAGERDTPVSRHRGATRGKKKPSGMTHGKSSRTERDGGEAKLLPLTRPRRAFGPVPGAAAGLLQGPPGQVGPSGAAAEPKYQCQNMWERQGGCEVGLCSYNTSHRIYVANQNTKTRRNPSGIWPLLTLRAAGVGG